MNLCMSLPGRALAALLVAAAVSACTHPAPTYDPATNDAAGESFVPATASQIKPRIHLPDPCNIRHDTLQKAGLKTFWKRPVPRDSIAGPGKTVKATQCRYYVINNPDLRVAIDFRAQDTQSLVDGFNGFLFQPTEINGRKAFLRPALGNLVCGVITDFKFGLMLVLVYNDNQAHCDQAKDIATAVEPWFKQWER